jgi:NitT/TauT family transport system substrate-binding protein
MRYGVFGRLTAVAAALVLCAAVAACGDDDDGGGGGGAAGGAAKVRGAIVPTGTHLPIMVAEDEGIFERNGVDMTLTVVQNLATLPGAMGRQFEFGSSTIPDVIKANQQGIDITLTSGVAIEESDNVTIGVLARKGSGIKSAKDLAGKKVGVVTLGGNIHTATLFWLVNEGVDPESVQFIEVPPPNHLDQIKSGDVDAVEILEPFRGAILATGAEQLVDPILEVIDPGATLSWMSSRSWAKENPDTVAAVRKSLDEAIQLIKDDEPRARAILAKYSGLDPKVANAVPLPSYSTELPPDEVAAWAKMLETIGQLEGSPDDVAAEDIIASAP